ncbi:MAG: sigma-70 family RNA polymerase sigma factor [Sedimentisphaerales bacterium]|nr:sigma-70 family RNA polymerase sigma factor [Sedimentisphaerales bacterium]
MAINEAILLKQFASTGDAEAFAEIVKLHAPLVYGVCLRILKDSDKAADAVQDTFIQLIRDVSRIRGSLPIWLHRVATHKAIDLIRKDSLRKQSEAEFAANSEKTQSDNEYVTWHDISVYIDKELDNLDEQMREVLILRFFEGLTTTEISVKCKISQPTVSRRLESGVGLLRHKLKSRGIVIPAVLLTTMLTENIVKAAPAMLMRELGKIAIAGGHTAAAATGAKIGSSLTANVIKTKIIVLATAIVIIIGSFAIYKYKSRPTEPGDIDVTITEEPTYIQQIELPEGIYLGGYAYPDNDRYLRTASLISHIYDISDLAKSSDDVNNIISLIQKNIKPESWYNNNENASGTIIAYTSEQTKSLTIRQSPGIHQKIAELLNSMKPSSSRNIDELNGQINLIEILIPNDSNF